MVVNHLDIDNASNDVFEPRILCELKIYFAKVAVKTWGIDVAIHNWGKSGWDVASYGREQFFDRMNSRQLKMRLRQIVRRRSETRFWSAAAMVGRGLNFKKIYLYAVIQAFTFAAEG